MTIIIPRMQLYNHDDEYCCCQQQPKRQKSRQQQVVTMLSSVSPTTTHNNDYCCSCDFPSSKKVRRKNDPVSSFNMMIFLVLFFLLLSINSVQGQPIRTEQELDSYLVNEQDRMNIIIQFRDNEESIIEEDDDNEENDSSSSSVSVDVTTTTTATDVEKSSSDWFGGALSYVKGIFSSKHEQKQLRTQPASSSSSRTNHDRKHERRQLQQQQQDETEIIMNTRLNRKKKYKIPTSVQKIIDHYSDNDNINNNNEEPLVTSKSATTTTSTTTMVQRFQRANGIAVKLTKQQIRTLLLDPNIEEIDRDRFVYPLQYSNEIQSYGIADVQAHTLKVPTNQYSLLESTASQSKSGKGCFKVCLIDSGLFVGHPDIPYSIDSLKIEGKEFNLPNGQRWYNPVYSHGTHVAGIMLARSNNKKGIKGVFKNAPRDHNICLMIARVFDDNENGQTDSVIAGAAEWCVDGGARVINMSLGSEGFGGRTMNQIYSNIRYNDNVLIFAASGNSGDSYLNYPASYDGVISVGATDDKEARASFSVYNSKVDLVAPGAAILSTVARMRLYDGQNNGYSMVLMDSSTRPKEKIVANQIDCGNGDTVCASATGRICLISRGTITFLEKARNCQLGGGIAVVIYNNEYGIFTGTLNSNVIVSIPVVSVSKDDGTLLKQNNDGRSITISMYEEGYSVESGTSMSTPFVAGVAAKLWSVRPKCTATQIENALLSSAKDLGPPGYDTYYGHGLVQLRDAYYVLLRQPEPCGSASILLKIAQSSNRTSTTTTSSVPTENVEKSLFENDPTSVVSTSSSSSSNDQLDNNYVDNGLRPSQRRELLNENQNNNDVDDDNNRNNTTSSSSSSTVGQYPTFDKRSKLYPMKKNHIPLLM